MVVATRYWLPGISDRSQESDFLCSWLVSGFDDRLIACLFIVILFELGSKNGDRGGFQRNVALRLKDHDMVGR